MKFDDLIASAELAIERKKFEAWRFYEPVAKQTDFFAAGAKFNERLFMAGNGNGKTLTGAYEVSRHLTGEYPDWWPGHRWTRPVRAWMTGKNATAVRDAAQTHLLGQPGSPETLGTGMVPKHAIIDLKASRSAPDAFDSILVRHKTGGVSRLVVKGYDQELQNWAGPDQDLIWYDEEPDQPHYTEGLARLRGRGKAMMTATPMLGMSTVIAMFYPKALEAQRTCIRMGIKDATWYSEEERQNQINSYPMHEREARANGRPLLGEGNVFRTPDVDLACPQPPPGAAVWKAMRYIWGVDFGINHPFAAVLLGIDEGDVPVRDINGELMFNDSVYVLHTIRMSGAIPLQHADAMRRVAINVPVAWPHDGHQRDKGSGEELSKIYARFGLLMLPDHATLPTGGYSTEAGVLEMDTYMQARRFKVCEHLAEWFDEYRMYHRKNGMIVKEQDDLLSATRIGFIMRRKARAVPLGGKRGELGGRVRRIPGADDGDYWGY